MVGLGNHFIADDIEHGAAGKGQGKGQHRGGDADSEEAHQGADDFHKTCGGGNQKGLLQTDAGREHGADDDHALGDVLQGNTTCDQECFRRIAGAEAHTGCDALGQVVDGDGHDKQQHLTGMMAALMILNVRAHQPVQVGNQLIDERQGIRAHENTGYGGDNAKAPPIFQRGQNQSQHRGCQHDTGSEGQDDVTEPV